LPICSFFCLHPLTFVQATSRPAPDIARTCRLTRVDFREVSSPMNGTHPLAAHTHHTRLAAQTSASDRRPLNRSVGPYRVEDFLGSYSLSFLLLWCFCLFFLLSPCSVLVSFLRSVLLSSFCSLPSSFFALFSRFCSSARSVRRFFDIDRSRPRLEPES